MLDHIVLAAPDLAAAVARFTELTGARPVPGGRHQGLGTANHLVGLGGAAYLEIIGPDPEAPDPPQPRPFGIDRLTTARVVTWAVRTSDLDGQVARARAAGYDPGQPRPMTRRSADGELLQWRLTLPDAVVGDGLVPFLIDWGDTPHPTSRGLPTIPLVSFDATHPDPPSVLPALAALGVDLPLRHGERARLTVALDSPRGRVELS